MQILFQQYSRLIMMLNRFLRVQLPALKERILYSCARFLEIEPSRLPCFTEDLEMDSLIKHSMIVAMEKGRRSHCLSLNAMEIVSGVLPRLSGSRVMAAKREILAPSSSLSPINDPIRSSNQMRLSSATRGWDHALEMHYKHVMNHLTEMTTVGLILMNVSMSVQVLALGEFMILPEQSKMRMMIMPSE